ncbi:hypothetical protein HY771_00385 [Candidatus Uhrbacteria bacterium]|nr:hypothetical protein [Candidatus Uhrbacteria bacterium]
MKLTVWVTFSDPLSHHATIRVRSEDPKEPRTYAVQVEYSEGASWSDISSLVISLAKKRHENEPSRMVVPARTRQPDSVPPPPPVFVFKPEEIEQFVDEMLTRMLAVAEKGIRLELIGNGTASTDCRVVVYFNPEPFLRGQIEAGIGRGLHEVGHIRFDQHGTRKDRDRKLTEAAAGVELLTRASAEGGEMLKSVLNLLMDRRADDLQVRAFPGNADPIYHRLGYLLPGSYLEPGTGTLVTRQGGISHECRTNVYVDFVYAIKKRTKPRHTIVQKCVRIAKRAISRVNKHKRRYEHLLTASKRIVSFLRSQMKPEDDQRFESFMQALQVVIYGDKVDPEFTRLFRLMMASKLSIRRRKSLALLPKQLAQTSQRAGSGSGHGSGAGAGRVLNTVKVLPNPQAYQSVLARVRPQVNGLKEVLRRLSIPEVNQLTGLTRGEFDLEALPVLATGRSDCMQIELREQCLDVGIAFLLDASGSMSTLKAAIELAVAFNEAVVSHRRFVESAFFAFNDRVFDCGSAQPNNGIAGVGCGGGTQEELGVLSAGKWLCGIRRPRKLLITICDGAPANVEAVKVEVNALLAHGILPMRLLVGVDVAPRTYPIELFFDSWSELNKELVKVFSAVIMAARTA